MIDTVSAGQIIFKQTMQQISNGIFHFEFFMEIEGKELKNMEIKMRIKN